MSLSCYVFNAILLYGVEFHMFRSFWLAVYKLFLLLFLLLFDIAVKYSHLVEYSTVNPHLLGSVHSLQYESITVNLLQSLQ